jgi:hypothetical protein
MSSPQLELVLWVMQPIIQAVIATIFYRRKLHQEFPAFFFYIVAQIPIFCVVLPVYFYEGSVSSHYFVVYWSAAALDLVLAFRIIHELFIDLFKPYHALKDLGTALFKWAAIIMVLVSVVVIAVSPNGENPLTSSILVVQRCVRIVQCGLVIFLLAFCRSLGVNWRRLSFGIALGFGLLSGSELLTTALYSGGRIHAPVVNVISTTSYELAMLVWIFYSLVNRRSNMVPVLVPQRWDEALSDIHAPQAEADSLIPMFEHMVDQALSKTGNTHA